MAKRLDFVFWYADASGIFLNKHERTNARPLTHTNTHKANTNAYTRNNATENALYVQSKDKHNQDEWM